MYGKYQLLDEISRGGMGVVYRAYDPGLQRVYALKVLLTGDYPTEEAVERFLREARALARLRHPNIVGVHEVGFERDHPYLVMDYIEGGSLAARLDERGPLPVREALTLTDRLARAIDHAHGEGILHRDLKPANVLVDQSGAPLVTDFGLARDMKSRHDLTQTGAAVGTPAYMPPEQASGELENLGPRSDVYAIGAVLYELLSGRRPFEGSNPMNVLTAILTKKLPPLPREVPADVRAIVAKAMAKEPGDRYDSAAALSADIRRWLRGEPVEAHPDTLVGALTRAIRRHKALTALLLLLLGSIIGGAWLATRALEAEGINRSKTLEKQALEAEQKGEIETALSLLEDATRHAPDRFGPWRALARVALARDSLDVARRAAERASALAPSDGETLYLLGRIADEGDRAEDALFAYRAARDAGYERGDLVHRLASLLLEREQPLDARNQLTARLRTHPDDTRALTLRADAHRALEATHSAREDLWRILERAPGDEPAFEKLVRSLLEAGKPESLERLWQEFFRRLGTSDGDGLQSITEDQYPDFLSLAGDESAPLSQRLRAVLGLARFPRGGAAARLRVLLEDRDLPPILRSAARASLLSHRGAYDIDDWVDNLQETGVGVHTIATLFEQTRYLSLDPLRRLAGGTQDAPLLQKGIALAIGVSFIRTANSLPARDGFSLLAKLADPAAGQVHDALRILTRDTRPDTVSDEAVLLALRLTKLPEAATRPEYEQRARQTLDARAEENASPRLLLAQARVLIEEGQPEAARSRLEEGLDQPNSAVLEALYCQALRAPDEEAEREKRLSDLEQRDPVLARRARRRSDLAQRQHIWALEGPLGATRLVFDLSRKETVASGLQFFSSKWSVEKEGLRTEGVTTILSQVEGWEWYDCEVLTSMSVIRIRFHWLLGAHFGYGFTTGIRKRGLTLSIDEQDVVQLPSSVGHHRASHRVRLGRGEFVAYSDGRPVMTIPTQPRRLSYFGPLCLEYGWSLTPHVVKRILAVGHLRKRRSMSVPPRTLLTPAPRTLRLESRNLPNAPETLGQLQDGGLTLQPRGRWVGGAESGRVVFIPDVRGDARIEATVTFRHPSLPHHHAGIGIRNRRGEGDKLWFCLASGADYGPWDRSIWLFFQRQHTWQTPLMSIPWTDETAVLRLDRRGDWVIPKYGRVGSPLKPLLDHPLHFPLDEPIDLFLFGRAPGRKSFGLATFQKIKVLKQN